MLIILRLSAYFGNLESIVLFSIFFRRIKVHMDYVFKFFKSTVIIPTCNYERSKVLVEFEAKNLY